MLFQKYLTPCVPHHEGHWIELLFPVMGDRIPISHGYRLYSAVVSHAPALKENDRWMMAPISGREMGGYLKLGRESRLLVRCPLELMQKFSVLDGQYLRLGQSILELGAMEGRSIALKRSLHSSCVAIRVKGFSRPHFDQFAVALGRACWQAGIKTYPRIGKAQSLAIKENTVHGFAVSFDGLSQQESFTLQRFGLGGKHHMGCGVFV